MTNRTDHIGRGCLPLLPMKRMALCEANGVDFLFGRAKKRAAHRRDQDRARCGRRQEPTDRQGGVDDARTWSRRRGIVAKAEWTQDEAKSPFRGHLPRRPAAGPGRPGGSLRWRD